MEKSETQGVNDMGEQNNSALERFFGQHSHVTFNAEIKGPLCHLIGESENDISAISILITKLGDKIGHQEELLHYIEEIEAICEQARNRELGI